MKRLISTILALLMVLAVAVPAMAETEKELVTLSMWVDMDWFWFDEWGTDPVSRKITELTGVTFDVTRATSGDQLPLMIAGGTLPDIVYTSSGTKINLLSDPEVCYSYTDLVSEYGVDIHATESEIANNTAADGKYYCLRNAYTSQEAIDAGTTLLSGGCKSIAYRTDIWEELGSPEINTMEDLEKVLLAAKELHPELIPMFNENGYLVEYFKEQLGLNGGGYVGYNAEGKPVFLVDLEKTKEIYATLNRFAREGLISQEAQTYNYDKYVEIRNSGYAFMLCSSADVALRANLDATSAGTGLHYQLITHELGEDALVSVNTGIGWAGTFITKNCSNPKAAIEWMSFMRSEEGRKLGSWGIENVDWYYDEQGRTCTTPEYQEQIAAGKDKWEDFGIGCWIFGDQGDENAFVDYAVTDPDTADYYDRLRSAVKNTKVMSELFKCIPTGGDEELLYDALVDVFDTAEMKIIFAATEEEFEAEYANMYQQAVEVGLEEMNAWMQAQLPTV